MSGRYDEPGPGKGLYAEWREAQEKTYFRSWPAAAQAALYGYLAANGGETGRALGFSSPPVLVALVLLLGLTAAWGLGVSAALCRRYTGIAAREDQVAFALAGGFDVGRVPMLLAQVAVYGVYWGTAPLAPDPIAPVRGPWLFVLLATVAGLLATAAVGAVVFKRYGD